MSRIGKSILALLTWTISRVLMAVLWSRRETFIDNDVRYYYWQLVHHGMGDGLVEYPTPVAVLLQLIRPASGNTELGFRIAFVLVMGLLDGAVAVWLWTGHSRVAATYWSVFTFLIGALIWFRIDLLPAVAVLAGLVWLNRRPIASGVAIALGAATKFWPAMLIIPMLGTGSTARKRTIGFLVAGGTLGLASLLFFGWDRSTSPLTWQSDRGLQIESIVATVPMLRHAFGQPDLYRTELSSHNAWEIYGPQVDFWLRVADVAMLGSVVLALLLGWLIALNGFGLPGRRSFGTADDGGQLPRTHAIVLAQLAIVCAFIIANKTFSPQYVIWLGGPLTVLIALPLPGKDRTAARWLAGTGLAIALLTHLVFPLNYSGLIAADSTLGDTLLLVGRNLLMVVFTVMTTVAAIRAAIAIGRPQPAVSAT